MSVRTALVDALASALDQVQVWGSLRDSLPHTPAVVVRANELEPVDLWMAQLSPCPSYDLICVTDQADDSRVAEMDDLVVDVVAAVRADPTLGAQVSDCVVTRIGDEELVPISGQTMLARPVTVEVVV